MKVKPCLQGSYDASQAWIAASQSDRAHIWTAHQLANFWRKFQ